MNNLQKLFLKLQKFRSGIKFHNNLRSNSHAKSRSLERLNESDIFSLEHDLMMLVYDFRVDNIEIVMCEYIRRGSCQPKDHTFLGSCHPS